MTLGTTTKELQTQVMQEISDGRNPADGSSARYFNVLTTRKWSEYDAMAWQAHKGFIAQGYGFFDFRVEQVAAPQTGDQLFYIKWSCSGNCD